MRNLRNENSKNLCTSGANFNETSNNDDENAEDSDDDDLPLNQLIDKNMSHQDLLENLSKCKISVNFLRYLYLKIRLLFDNTLLVLLKLIQKFKEKICQTNISLRLQLVFECLAIKLNVSHIEDVRKIE